MTAGILIGAAGLVLVLLAGGAIAAGTTPATAGAPDDAGPLAPVLGRLRLARLQLIGTLGPLGAFVMFLGAGVLVITPVAAASGFGAAALEHPVDWWAFHLADRLHSPGWARAMNVVTRMGDLDETRITAAVAAVVLAFVTRRRWAPAVAIGSVVVVEKYQQSLLAAIVDRGHPPTTLGTYPSGGCARLISIYGVILFLVLERLRIGRPARAAAWTLLAAAAFAEGYSRWYLNKHWITDVLGGWFYGVLLLAIAVFAARTLTGSGQDPVPPRAERERIDTIARDSGDIVPRESQQCGLE